MNEIVIKKSELLTMKYGLGKSNDEIALKYNISKKEAIDALETFGLIKKRGDLLQVSCPAMTCPPTWPVSSWGQD